MTWPHPDEFISLNLEQRGLVVLRGLTLDPRSHNGRDNIIGGQISHYWPGYYGPGAPPQPKVSHRDFEQSAHEAFEWLHRSGLVMHDASQRGSTNWFVVTELGKEVRDSRNALRAIEARKLMSVPVDARLEKARKAFFDGDYEGAVFKAMRAVEIAVRDAAGAETRAIGKDLMMQAFAKDGPLTDPEMHPGEQEGWKFLYAGAVLALKNPGSHRDEEIDDPADVFALIYFADYLIRTADDASH